MPLATQEKSKAKKLKQCNTFYMPLEYLTNFGVN